MTKDKDNPINKIVMNTKISRDCSGSSSCDTIANIRRCFSIDTPPQSNSSNIPAKGLMAYPVLSNSGSSKDSSYSMSSISLPLTRADSTLSFVSPVARNSNKHNGSNCTNQWFLYKKT